MSKIKQYCMAAGTFSIALGIGFVMQNGDALANKFGSDAEIDDPARFTQPAATPFQSEPTNAPLEAEPVSAPAAVMVEQSQIVAQIELQALPVAPDTTYGPVIARSEQEPTFKVSDTPMLYADILTDTEVAVLPSESLVILAEAQSQAVPISSGSSAVLEDLFIGPVVIVQSTFTAPMDTTGVSKASSVILPTSAEALIQQDVPVQLIAFDPVKAPEIEDQIVDVSSISCVPNLSALAGTAAMLTVSVDAECHKLVSFTIHHEGMMFTAMTDETGSVNIEVPALAETAVVIAAFPNGDGAVATTPVPDFPDYDRAVLQWVGDTKIMLSAYEGDAEFGETNHIHAGNPGDIAQSASSQGGYLVRLGADGMDDSLIAEIYTFPTDLMRNATDVTIVAEAEITASNCGRELNAKSIQVSPSGTLSTLDLSMIMPNCDAIGDFLILQNMFEDLTLASR